MSTNIKTMYSSIVKCSSCSAILIYLVEKIYIDPVILMYVLHIVQKKIKKHF